MIFALYKNKMPKKTHNTHCKQYVRDEDTKKRQKIALWVNSINKQVN